MINIFITNSAIRLLCWFPNGLWDDFSCHQQLILSSRRTSPLLFGPGLWDVEAPLCSQSLSLPSFVPVSTRGRLCSRKLTVSAAALWLCFSFGSLEVTAPIGQMKLLWQNSISCYGTSYALPGWFRSGFWLHPLCLFQFGQASAVRSYTKFVMGVSSPKTVFFFFFFFFFLTSPVINSECVFVDRSECSHLPVHAGRWCDGSQQLWVSFSGKRDQACLLFTPSGCIRLRSELQPWCLTLIGCALCRKSGCRSSSSISHL